MRVLITGACGFVGSNLAQHLAEDSAISSVVGLDNLTRPGSWTNVRKLNERGIEFVHGDVRAPADLEKIGKVDWIIDAAASPSVLAGTNSEISSRQLVDSNLVGTLNLLEHCKIFDAGFVLLSTSRVYSIQPLANLPVSTSGARFQVEESPLPPGVSANGIRENFSVSPPISLYGATKLSSEYMAIEYAEAFEFPVWVNRCGVLAGAGQFGRADQGIFAFWLHSWREESPLKYIGFDGQGRQVRDCLHPADLANLVLKQVNSNSTGDRERVLNVSGGRESSMSLAELSNWCSERWGQREIEHDLTPRKYDLPWIVLDSTLAKQQWQWSPQKPTLEILEEIAAFAEESPNWLALSRGK